MSAIIIDFADHKERKSPMAPRHPDHSTLEVHRMIRLGERRAIREIVDRNPTFSRSDDALKIARRLTQKLETARIQGIRRVDIVANAFPNDDKPLKRLHKVGVPATGQASEKRLGHLERHPRNYAKVAEAMASLLREQSEDILLYLFRGTSVEQEIEAVRLRLTSGSDPSDDWGSLAGLIETMATAVSDRTGLPDHMRRIATVPGAYDLATESIVPARSPLLPHGPLVYGYEMVDEFPPIPSVVLFENLRVPRLERTIRFRSEGRSSKRQPDMAVEVAVWREVRLAIGPADQVEIPSALFEVRTRVEMSVDNESIAIRRPWLYLMKNEPIEVILNGQVIEADIDVGRPEGVLHEVPPKSMSVSSSWVPLEGEGLGYEGSALQPEHVYATWYPVTAATCNMLLGMEVSGDASTLRLGVSQMVSDTVLPTRTVGAAVEADLISERGSIERELEVQARRLVSIVEDHVSVRRQRAHGMHDRALARWSRQ